MTRPPTQEHARLREADLTGVPWRQWGPYVSDRQWGTVREDYSDDGDAWGHFTFDQARSRAYRCGEDGLAGFCDDRQHLCLSLALWNGADPFLKERLFGLTNAEGNHGEDVKEYYFHLDATPTHSYQRLLYKYPQRPFPYEDLVATNRARTRLEPEYELLDTGAFDDDRYFDVVVEYAKGAPDDVCMRVTATNRGPGPAELHLLPTVWFRNTWGDRDGSRPCIRGLGPGAATVTHEALGEWALRVDEEASGLFCDNESNLARLYGQASPLYPKDAINDAVVGGRADAVNPAHTGTKFAAWRRCTVGPGASVVARLRLRRAPLEPDAGLGADFDEVLDARSREADEFYEAITPPSLDEDRRNVLRQALAGVLWTKQFYEFDVDQWLRDHDAHPLRTPKHLGARNANWFHMRNGDVISMPDKWEYPWFAAWDLAFHTLALEMVDPEFAKAQIDLMLSEPYLHPSGQLPAYEWNFGDVNPPVHAWATLFAYMTTFDEEGTGDIHFLREAFKKLLLNFTWWVNRKDREGNNLFEGGFLGLDNIGVFDRSSPLPTGGHLEQADGTAWMALYSQNMLELALELAVNDPSYEDLALKFVQHFFWIAAAMDPPGDADDELWDEEDGFFYDVLCLPDGTAQRLKIRSMVGLLPLCAVTVVSQETVAQFPRVIERVGEYLRRNADLLANIADPTVPGVHGRRLLSVLNEPKLRRVLARMLDEERFLSPHGVRSLSRSHLAEPFRFDVHGERFEVKYLPAESDTGLFGGNSNWRGPVWFPTNLLLLRALLQYYLYYGDDFRIECPTGSGVQMTLFEVARDLAERLCSVFLRDDQGRRPVYGSIERFQRDEHWRDLILFHEYFHGDTGAGLGASHQTGWTSAAARLLQMFGAVSADQLLHGSTRPMARPWQRSPAASRDQSDVSSSTMMRGPEVQPT